MALNAAVLFWVLRKRSAVDSGLRCPSHRLCITQHASAAVVAASRNFGLLEDQHRYLCTLFYLLHGHFCYSTLSSFKDLCRRIRVAHHPPVEHGSGKRLLDARVTPGRKFRDCTRCLNQKPYSSVGQHPRSLPGAYSLSPDSSCILSRSEDE